MKAIGLVIVLLTVAFVAVTSRPVVRAPAAARAETGDKEPRSTPPTTTARKIQNALSAAPRPVATGADVLDWPPEEGADFVVLRKGRNGWTCLPDDPSSPGNDPMCLDAVWLQWLRAYVARKPFTPTAAGLAYMLQGGSTASNSDPFASAPPPGEPWMVEPPHLMIIVPGKLDGPTYSADPHSGRPWVMWGGTPYEHLMVPVR